MFFLLAFFKIGRATSIVLAFPTTRCAVLLWLLVVISVSLICVSYAGQVLPNRHSFILLKKLSNYY
jgi:hypothetical protein